MRITFRPYQNEAVSLGLHNLIERGNSLIVAATGSGKTIMLAELIGRFYEWFIHECKRRPHVLVLVHRTEIHDQNHIKFSNVRPEIQTSELTAERKSLNGNVHFGMVQTVYGLLDEFERGRCYFDLVVVDECHHSAASTYKSIIDWNKQGNPDAKLFGVTATPNRGDKLPLIHLFDNYSQITTKFLIDSHYLVRPRFIDLSPVFSVQKKTKDSKFKSIIEKGRLNKNCKVDFEGKLLISKLCNDYLKYKEPDKTMIFAPSHKFCIAIVAELKALGRNPAYLSSGLDKLSRKEEIKRFENGDADELVNVDIATEGYDFPELRNIVDFDTNGTHTQWVQKVGRVLRIATGKTSCTVLDFGGNIDNYPDGIESGVDLEGYIKDNNLNMTEIKLSVNQTEEKQTFEYTPSQASEYTPYNLPKGFESILDSEIGIVFVACSLTKECIISPCGEKNALYIGDKSSIKKACDGDFEKCMAMAIEHMGSVEIEHKPISNMQIKLLSPRFPTMTLDWYGANCTLCWKAWESEIKE